jgi:GntR family transcriptional repressor for pyruvate dehydrogenase complex
MADGDTVGGRGPGRAPGLGHGERTTIRIPKTAELVADSIRRQITGGELKEGDTLLPEAQIIEEFAVSRPTVREAFRILESEKLISVSRGSRGGARVHTPKADQVARYAGFVLQSGKASYRDVYEARIVIEPPAARLVAETRWKDAPATLRAVIAAQRTAQDAGDFGRAVATFHTRLIELTDNQTLILISAMLDGIVGRYQSGVSRASRAAKPAPDRTAEFGLKSQEKLVALIEARDGAGAEAHWRKHMENSAKVWLAGGPGDSVVDWTD